MFFVCHFPEILFQIASPAKSVHFSVNIDVAGGHKKSEAESDSSASRSYA